MGRYDKFYGAKDFILDMLKTELVGPVKKDEVLQLPPLNSYVSGILWPSSTGRKSGDELDYQANELLTDGSGSLEEKAPVLSGTALEGNDRSISETSAKKPSSMAVTAMIDGSVSAVKVKFSFAKYIHSEKKEARAEGDDAIRLHFYARREYSAECTFDFTQDKPVYQADKNDVLSKFDIRLQANKRLGKAGENRLISFSVTNLAAARQKEIEQNEGALFQCELELTPEGGFFVPLQAEYINTGSIEDEILSMHYRKAYSFARGHGCATVCAADEDKCLAVKSEFIPVYEFKQLKPRSSSGKIFSMKYLYEGERKDIVAKLNEFVGEYSAWAEELKKRSCGAEFAKYVKAAKACLSNIAVCISRIKKGIEILAGDDIAWRAFTLCNAAMYRQRAGMALMKGKIKKREEFALKDPSWYPFQLFYLIMIIPDFVCGGKYKDAVDLLWFPTGGGKTEAYLGVSAFVIFYERLKRRRAEYGTAIIMRYTLRLLTIQQFERAAALICACEAIRKENSLGGNEISIALWIGSDSTPNNIEDAAAALNAENEGRIVYGADPIQLTKCPYCGRELDATNYHIEDGGMAVKCDCIGKLPVYIVDTDIYNKKPTLIVSTVDKFARIVWEEKAGNLFGCHCGEVNKPQLIIQDELHLISGPLGTLTGLYESAVDRLCWSEDSKPKIIASTATIKNAAYQVRGLYDREYFQFPPSGLDSEDSFFAAAADKDERPCRYYIGTAEQGGSVTDLIVRIFSLLSLADHYLSKDKSVPKEVADQYYTIIGYFNAIRDLGSASTTLKERMSQTVSAMLNGKFAEYSALYNIEKSESGRYKNQGGIITEELTSRKASSEIRRVLRNLDNVYDGESNENGALKYVLSSNMFSVGVDIDRLGIMTMFCQPKTNAEYIQATSRVGRSNPGIVICMYNAFRSRDRSYYEQFNQFHNSFYRFVEPTSVTPFSDRSIEKGLHSVFAALVRHLVPGMSGNAAAKNFDSANEDVIELKNYLISRIRDIQPDNCKAAERYLDTFIEYWEERCGQNLVYDKLKEGRNMGTAECLLHSAEVPGAVFPVLNSVRNVENGADVYIKSGDIGK